MRIVQLKLRLVESHDVFQHKKENIVKLKSTSKVEEEESE